jgi:hypothetical protein
MKVPNLGEDDTKAFARVVKWYKKAGQKIKPGATFCDVEFKGAFVIGMDLEDGGIMGEHHVEEVLDGNEGWMVPGVAICDLLENEEKPDTTVEMEVTGEDGVSKTTTAEKPWR